MVTYFQLIRLYLQGAILNTFNAIQTKYQKTSSITYITGLFKIVYVGYNNIISEFSFILFLFIKKYQQTL